jgi:hypothetical protein
LTREHDDFGRIRTLVHATEQLHAVHARHVDVAQQHIDVALFQFPQRGFTVRRDVHTITESLQFFLQHQAQVRLVFGYQ